MRQPFGVRSSVRIVPSWRSTIQRAIARPRPAASVAGRARLIGAVEALEDPLGLRVGDARALRRSPRGRRRDRSSGRPRRRRCRRASDGSRSRPGSTTTWCRRASSALSDEVVGLDHELQADTTGPRALPPVRRDPLEQRRRADGVRARAARRRTPAWRGRAAARRAGRDARPAPASSRGVSVSAVSTPSTRFSSIACRAPSGVRSSWETFATRSRRTRSASASSAAIRLNARAELADLVSRGGGDTPVVVASRHRARRADHLAQRRVMPRASTCTRQSASVTAAIPVRTGERPARSPSQNDDDGHEHRGDDDDTELELDRRERSRAVSQAVRVRVRSRRREPF